MGKGGTQTNRPKDKEIEGYAQGFTPERRHKWTEYVKKRRRKQTQQH